MSKNSARALIVRKMPDPWFQCITSAGHIGAILSAEPLRRAGPGERQLGPYVVPPFQRLPVWSKSQRVRLIESIWSRLPIGAYCYNQTYLDHPTDGWLLDGQQRITAILAYVAGEFEVFGYRFTDLDRYEKVQFKMMPIGVLITNIQDAAVCEDVYNRLAYGGTAHEVVGGGGVAL
jgi:hypothetical protein